MRRCIFCGRTEAEFIDGNKWTEEHIIPESLGNETLKIYDVCKKCNSGLGTYVDKYFVDHMLVKIIRQDLGLKGQSGEVPNAFKEGRDKDGHLIRVDMNYKPHIVQYVEQNENKIKFVASSIEEAKKMAYKKLKRMNMTDEQIESEFKKITNIKNEEYQPEIGYDITVEFNRFYMEALKIAYEYAIYKLGDTYLEDVTAKKIKHYLYRAIRGEMKEECEECPNVCLTPEFIGKMLSQAKGINCHMLFMHSDAQNKLIVQVMLFLNPIFSFSVCISENASQYEKAKELPVEIVDIKYERKE